MKWLNIAVARLRGLFQRDAVLSEVDEELRLHIDLETEANIRRGMCEADARDAALRSFGNVGAVKDIAHDIRGGGTLETLWRDIRFALRVLAKSPTFTLVAVAALALGIGTTTTAFSAFNTLFLRPMPLMPEQAQVVYISETLKDQNVGVSYPDYLEWKKQVTTLEGILAIRSVSFIVSGTEKPERYRGANISADAFSVLGVEPILGRGFHALEDDLRAAPVALISHDVWQNRFGGDHSIVGRTISISAKQVTIVGVMPKGWHFPDVIDVWMPLQLEEKDHPRSGFSLQAFGRLKPGVSLTQARAELEDINGRLALQYPETNTGRGVHLNLLREQATGPLKQTMVLVLGAVLLVQLIACGNLANLLLARGATRAQEFAVRIALGASRAHIVRQLLAESVVIGIAGCALGLMLTVWGVHLIRAAFPAKLPFWVLFDLDWRICAFAVGTAGISTMLFGLFPAIRASRPQLLTDLKQAGGAARGGGKAARARNSLVISQMALAMILLVGASLMLRSLSKLEAIELGADPSNTLTFKVVIPPEQVSDSLTPARFFERLIPRLANLPGVEAAGASSSLPGTGVSPGALLLEGDPEPAQPHDGRPMAGVTITPGFLRTARIQLLRGRDFGSADTADAPRVVLIDEEAAQLWFSDREPIGQRVRALLKPGDPPEWATIVGVVARVAYQRSFKRRQHPVVYFAHSQIPPPFMAVALRTKTDPKTFVNVARETVLAVSHEVPAHDLETMDEVLADSFWTQKFFGSLFTVFAVLAVLLASVGLYGVLAYSVRQRTQEIGLRMALGAQRADVFRLVTVHRVRLIMVGLTLGLLGAFFLARLLAGSLHGIAPRDPLSFTIVPLVLLLVGLLACYLPARSAVRLDPMEALRHD